MRAPIIHPSAWRRADLERDQSWIFRLEVADVEAIDAAFRTVQKRGLIWGEFGKEDFPLDAFGETLRQVDEEIRDGRGLALIRGFPVDAYDLEDLKTIYWGIGCHLGTILSNNTAGEFVSAVTDAGTTIPELNRRNNTTNRELYPHTDPSDIVSLLCINRAERGGMSSLTSSMTVYNEILANHPEYVDVLHKGFPRDDRGLGPDRDPDAVSPAIPIYDDFEGNLSAFFSRGLLLDGARKAGIALSEVECATIDIVHDYALRDDLRIDMMLERGDIQLINNYRMFHARTEYVDPQDGPKRYLLRMWINIPDGTQLSPDFARYVRRGILPAVSTRLAHQSN